MATRRMVDEACCRRGGVAGAEPPHKGGPTRPDRPNDGQELDESRGFGEGGGAGWRCMDGRRGLVVADAGVDHDVDDVHDEEGDDCEDGEEDDVEEDDGIVAGHDGLGHEVADAGPGEDDFDDDDGADEVGEG